ncbi:MAG: heat-inducible transcriptional repressor HrcA [Eubacteriales bacterium]|nr:heat-inducible transcriptional repressor HrcA [Eubacteriales bacterium]
MITARKKQVLEAIIKSYVQTAEPVGSRTISRKYMPDFSSATIRNEMSDLEEMGYLDKPHVSAGRVPNVHAYRLYVDHLINDGLINPIKESDTQKALTARVQQLEDLVCTLAQSLSEMSRYTVAVMMPRQKDLRVKSLQLMPVSGAKALLVVITDAGTVRDALVHVSEHLNPDALYTLSRAMSEHLSGKTMREVQNLLEGIALHASLDPRVLQGVAELAKQMEKQASTDRLMVFGAQNILYHPEFSDVEKARSFLSVVEEKQRLLNLLARGGQRGINAYIGHENGIVELKDCSIVTASYDMGDKSRGSVAVIGPMRMPYQEVLTTLSTTANILSGMLKYS